jgi:hypothetical protein
MATVRNLVLYLISVTSFDVTLRTLDPVCPVVSRPSAAHQ